MGDEDEDDELETIAHFQEIWADWQDRHEDPRTECAEDFCFHWASTGAQLGPPGATSSLEEGLAKLGPPIGNARCALPHFFPGLVCRRLTGEGPDYFEPCEPHLYRAGLPEDGSTFWIPPETG